ncbi:peptidoglycan editing factor PgeF [Stenotrophomonas sp. HITSZ_GD]|uniref:peptidoglycan editing factor PgeF n=1 Tax=Stenotrophomonas sp. HITSZ_GD TaxID=3037248 RepID=UPI00240D4573|nr:peptidoglycan editing factor PgeF [Stenotrophomonas sp. HITSZ_GD]MDG2525802.1 peptidoglycan editing factor PgeF [Stenotrophomonas sp. HITSZ_GD]
MAAAMPWLAPDWPVPAGVRALVTLRHGAGVSAPPFDDFNLGNRSSPEGDRPEAVAANRAQLQALAGLPSAPHWLRQVHGTAVLRFDAPPAGQGPEHEPTADAAVTSVPGVVLAILTADCLPVVFAADDGREIGAAHAGWRGLADGVLERTVAAMHTPPARLHAWLGPAAGPQAYEIGEDVRAAFLAHDPAAQAAFVATRPGHWRVDLYALARQRLLSAGLAPEALHGGDRCTISEPQHFFSHRRDRRSGRLATLAWIAP